MQILKKERLGEVNISNEGYEMKIVEYNGRKDITVEFQDEYKTRVHTRYDHFLEGIVKNPYNPSIFNKGYIGQGKYKIKENGKTTKAYQIWYNMLQRCYDPYWINKHLTYIDCYIYDEWLCFQNFAKWFYKNYYECNGERIELDKDILIKGNKIYSPETCILVPQRINLLFIKRDTLRGKCPIGVSFKKNNNKFQAYCSILKNDKKKQIYLGYYDTSEDAFLVYKNFKENYIKQVADEYKDLIPNRLYEAMYRYEIEIND